jgi:hypothetical protein
MSVLVLEALLKLAPIIQSAVDHFRAGNGRNPTDAEMEAILHASVNRIVAEGAAWEATHVSPAGSPSQ